MTNPVFCSAEDDAAPTQTEIKACSFYFNMLIDRLKPKVFLCLGMTAFQSVTEGQYRDARLSELAGSPVAYATRLGIPAWLVYHPAFFFKGTPEVEQAKEKTKITLDSLKTAIKAY